MTFRQQHPELVCEQTSSGIELQLTDEHDQPLDKAQLDSVTLDLYVASKGPTFGQTLNGADARDILDVNGGTVSTTGLLLVTLSPADNELTLQSKGFELHVYLIRWTWNNGAGQGAKEGSFTVANQSRMG